MINVYPTRVEAIKAETGDVMFIMETMDSHAASVRINTVISPSNVDELTAALRRAVVMLELE